MKYIACILSLFILLIAPTTLVAQDAQSNVTTESVKTLNQIFSQQVAFTLPKGWKPLFKNETGNAYMMEFVPANESKESWNTMFTVQGFKDLGKNATPTDVLSRLAFTYVQICGREHLVLEQVNENPVSGHDAKSMILGCSNMQHDHPSGLKKGMGEVTYFVVVRGKSDMYLFQKAKRGTAFDPKSSPITIDNAEAFVKDFMPIEIL